MHEEIAVLVNEEMRTSYFSKAGKVVVYKKSGDCWEVIKTVNYSVNNSSSLREMREIIIGLLTKLGKCRIMVAREVTGAAYNILAVSGFNIWELEGVLPEFLDYILESEEKSQKKKGTLKEIEVIPYPKEIKDGHYFINLKEIQQENTELSSKQILLPFLSGTVFYKLQVICSHTPPWLYLELEKLGMQFKEAKVNEGEYNVIIYKKVCER